MKPLNRLLSLLAIISLMIFFASSSLYAKEGKAKLGNLAISDGIKLIDIAGQQRMISQRIAKDYLYRGRGIAVDKADAQLKESIRLFKKNQRKLSGMIQDPEIKNLLSFVNMSLDELEGVSKRPFNLNNAQLILDLSESMLEGSQYIVDSIKNALSIKESKIVAEAGRQRMLAQRIAKYYIAYQAGIKDKTTVEQMKKSVDDFSTVHKLLMQNKDNTATINKRLSKVDKLWGVVYKFYLNIEKGGLPFIVFTSTDDITRMMNEITELYVELYK
jgi:hypothetical protein